MTIKELREKEGLSQSALAKKLGINTSAIGHMENGRMKVSANIAAKVQEAFGVDVSAEAKAAKLDIIIQSPMGGNITPEEIAAKLPEGAESVFVRVDQNKLWWIKGEETGSVDIW